MNSNELSALIKLLDDTDTEVFEQIETRLISLGKEVIPALENAWGSSFDALMQQRIENIIHKIQFQALTEALKQWKDDDDGEPLSLLKGAILVARYQYPDLDEEKLKIQIEQLKRDIWIELNDNLTALEQIRVFNHIFYDVHGFAGNTSNYHAPQNSFINQVVETRKGNPLSLGLLYTFMARELSLPVYGVNLPDHFILAYMDKKVSLPLDPDGPEAGVLFYINPFSKGIVFNRKEIDTFLRQLHLTPRRSFFTPCAHVEIIQRMLRNLVSSYEKLGYKEKTEELAMLLAALE